MPDFTREEWIRFPETIGSTSPSNTGFSMDGGKASMEFMVGSEQAWKVLEQLIGNCSELPLVAGKAKAGLQRKLPLAHPQFPWFFATAIESYKGHKYKKTVDYIYEVTEDPNARLLAPAYPVFADYSEYKISVGFEPRPYKILPDEYIEFNSISVTYFPPKPNDSAILFSGIWPEWERFCYVTSAPRTEYLSGNLGQYAYYIPSMADKTPPQDVYQMTNAGQVKILIPSKVIVAKWFQVPYSYVTGSNTANNKTVFELAIGNVNQYPMFGKDVESGYPAGSLLLEAVNVSKIYPKPFPELKDIPGGIPPLTYKGYDGELLCDLEFVFIYRNPKSDEIYPEEGGNEIYAGHNLLPYLQGNTWYAGIIRAAAKDETPEGIQPMIYPSFPMELLFCNPQWVFETAPDL